MNKTICYMIFVGLFISCTSDTTFEKKSETICSNEYATVLRHEFEYEDGTRTTLTKTDNGVSCTWKEGDEIGVIPVSSSDKTRIRTMRIKEGGVCKDGHYAQFTCDGWELDQSKKYSSFYPFYERINPNSENTSIIIDLTSQTQTGDNNISDLQYVDYMYATSTFCMETDANGVQHNVGFDYKHLISIMELHLNMPLPERWSKIIIENADSDKVFVSKAKLDLLTGKLTPIERSSSITLSLSYVKSEVDNHNHTFYVAALPTTTGELCIKAVTSDGAEFMTYVESKTLQSGKIYKYTDNHWEVDLGLSVNWAAVNIGTDFITEEGWYFSWGEVIPKTDYAFWDNYKWATDKVQYIYDQHDNGSFSTVEEYFDRLNSEMTKYQGTYYGTENVITELEPEDDAATYYWGKKWKSPSYDEIVEIIHNTYQKYLNNYNGIPVNKVWNEKAGSKNYIYAAFSKILNENGLSEGSNAGFWMTRSYNHNNIHEAFYLIPVNFTGSCIPRYNAGQVRAVCEKRKKE